MSPATSRSFWNSSFCPELAACSNSSLATSLGLIESLANRFDFLTAAVLHCDQAEFARLPQSALHRGPVSAGPGRDRVVGEVADAVPPALVGDDAQRGVFARRELGSQGSGHRP
jgi:hypothetical protein